MKKGIAAICGTGILTCVCWALSSPQTPVGVTGQVSQLIGGLALTGFAMMFFTATRARVLDQFFSGLDKAYVVHKWLGVVSVCLVVLHFATHGGVNPRGIGSGRGSGFGQGRGLELGHGLGPWGVASMLLFAALVLIALFAVKLKYEVWKLVHMLMAIAYTIGLIHYYGSSTYNPWGVNPFSLWLDLVNLVGVAAAVYTIFLYELLGFRHAYQITELRQVGQGNLEITAATSSRPLSYRPGQFTFVKFPDVRFTSHPFTIAAAGNGQTLQFAIRALGDHTSKLGSTLKVGARLVAAKAHGRFDYTSGTPRQIWIAAGIGITPFRAFIQAGVPEGFKVDFFYSYKSEQGAYLDELAAPINNVQVHLIDTATSPRLSAQQIVRALEPNSRVDVYFCGPKIMREALRKDLKASELNVVGFHFEEFTFGR
ncbi:MAG: ferric reductase-like transmembrane domain-containing protein [Propionibacteriaceae bacterium]|nr:ferric reductase-like transmembrane domain-containing protein [Propionibacteriaceae bacterium]